MNTIAASDVAVLVRGRGWRALFEVWCATAALIAGLDLLLWLELQGVREHTVAVPALMLSALAPAAVATLQKRGPLMWLQGRQLYYESLWTGELVDLTGLSQVEAGGGLLGRPRSLILRRRGRAAVRIRIDDWCREDLRRLLLALIDRPGVRFDLRLRRLLADPALAAA